MKKLIVSMFCVIILFGILLYTYYNYKAKKDDIDNNNLEYSSLYNKEITGNTLATIINKTIDSNNKNNIQRNENGEYIENNENSIKIDIKFTDSDKTFPMESIYANQISQFTKLYKRAIFKCTDIKYHKTTKYVKYLYFQEV